MTRYNTHKSVSPIWLKQVATALSSRYNVAIREGKGWAMNIEKRVLVYPPEHLLALDRDTCLGLLLHELGHLHFTKADDWINDELMESNLKGIAHNAVNHYEDVRINEKMSQSYMGSRELIRAMNELLAGDGVKKFTDMNDNIISGVNERIEYHVPEWAEVLYITMAKLMGDNIFPNITPAEYYDKEKFEIIEDIVRVAKEQDVENMKSTKEVFDFVKNEVFTRIQQYLPQYSDESGQGDGNKPSDKEENGEKGKGKGKSDGTESDEKQESQDGDGGESEEQDEDSQDGDSQDGDSDDSEEQDGEKGGNGGAGDGKPDESATQKAERGGNAGVGGNNWKRELEEKVKNAIKRGRINPDENHRTIPYDKSGNKVREKDIPETCDVELHLERSKNLQRQFKNKFEAVFRDNQYARERENQRSGRVNRRVLHKFATGNTRLFKRKMDISKKSYAVAFGLDLSGSMYTQQVLGSSYAMLAFAKTLEALKIEHCIAYFSSYTAIGKRFGSKMVARKMSLEARSVNAGGTDLQSMIHTVFKKDLLSQKAEEHIGIILTDGMWTESDYEDMKELKRKHPKLHLYIVPLMLHVSHKEYLEERISDSASILYAESPEEVLECYIRIAKKHLI